MLGEPEVLQLEVRARLGEPQAAQVGPQVGLWEVLAERWVVRAVLAAQRTLPGGLQHLRRLSHRPFRRLFGFGSPPEVRSDDR